MKAKASPPKCGEKDGGQPQQKHALGGGGDATTKRFSVRSRGTPTANYVLPTSEARLGRDDQNRPGAFAEGQVEANELVSPFPHDEGQQEVVCSSVDPFPPELNDSSEEDVAIQDAYLVEQGKSNSRGKGHTHLVLEGNKERKHMNHL